MDETGRQALSKALLQRAPLWQAARERAVRLERGHTEDAADAARLADDYRLLAHDVARARELMPGSRTLAYLESAYARAHATLSRGALNPGSALRQYLRQDLPAAMRWLVPYLWWTTLIFVIAAVAGYALVARYPDMIAMFAGPEMISSVESGKLWTEGMLNVVPSSVLSVQIFANNIVVSIAAYVLGFLFGLGTLYILGLNGLMLGAVFAFVGQHGLAGELFKFIVAHGCVELSVMCISGAAGAAVGEALVRPGAEGRLESFRRAALRSGIVLLACAVLLVGAGLIEGFVSPNPRFALAVRMAIGVSYWIVMLGFLSGWLARFRLPAPARQPEMAARG